MEDSKRGDCNGFRSLAPEIISEILARLPIEWIMICKCVCKTWYDLINNTYFSKLQLSIAKDRPSSRIVFHSLIDTTQFQFSNLYLLDVEDCKVRKIPGYPLEEMDDIFCVMLAIISSNLDGLICFAPRYALDPVVIYNPLVRGDYIILPKMENTIVISRAHHITLAFDPSINKYKVVRMLNYKVDIFQHCLCEVITIGEENSWRRVVPPYEGLIHLLNGECGGGIFHQGSVYWIIHKSKARLTGETSNGTAYILEFDVTKENFRVISFSHSIRAPNYQLYNDTYRFDLKLQILRGSLALMKMDVRLLHIWRLIKQNGTVVVEYSKIRIESPYKYATIRSLLCPNNTEDFLFMQTHGGYQPGRSKNGERIRTVGTKFSYYYPYYYKKKKNERFVYLSGPQFQSSDEKLDPWCFKPSLISIKAASLSHL